MEKEKIGLEQDDGCYCLEKIPPQQNMVALPIEVLGQAAFDLRARLRACLDLRHLQFGQPPFACVVVL